MKVDKDSHQVVCDITVAEAFGSVALPVTAHLRPPSNDKKASAASCDPLQVPLDEFLALLQRGADTRCQFLLDVIKFDPQALEKALAAPRDPAGLDGSLVNDDFYRVLQESMDARLEVRFGCVYGRVKASTLTLAKSHLNLCPPHSVVRTMLNYFSSFVLQRSGCLSLPSSNILMTEIVPPDSDVEWARALHISSPSVSDTVYVSAFKVRDISALTGDRMARSLQEMLHVQRKMKWQLPFTFMFLHICSERPLDLKQVCERRHVESTNTNTIWADHAFPLVKASLEAKVHGEEDFFIFDDQDATLWPSQKTWFFLFSWQRDLHVVATQSILTAFDELALAPTQQVHFAIPPALNVLTPFTKATQALLLKRADRGVVRVINRHLERNILGEVSTESCYEQLALLGFDLDMACNMQLMIIARELDRHGGGAGRGLLSRTRRMIEAILARTSPSRQAPLYGDSICRSFCGSIEEGRVTTLMRSGKILLKKKDFDPQKQLCDQLPSTLDELPDVAEGFVRLFHGTTIT